MSSPKNNWFYEHFDTAGTAFGLRLKQKLEEVQTEYSTSRCGKPTPSVT